MAMAYDDARNVETILEVAQTAERLAMRMGKKMVLDERWRDRVDNHQAHQVQYVEIR
jgi:hypothetical protein